MNEFALLFLSKRLHCLLTSEKLIRFPLWLLRNTISMLLRLSNKMEAQFTGKDFCLSPTLPRQAATVSPTQRRMQRTPHRAARSPSMYRNMASESSETDDDVAQDRVSLRSKTGLVQRYSCSSHQSSHLNRPAPPYRHSYPQLRQA